MISKVVLIAVLCVTYTLAEAPRYRSQRFRQAPSRNFFARQEAPYPDSQQGGYPAAAYGPPSTPKPVYGPPPTPQSGYGPPAPVSDPEISNESVDAEALSGKPSRLTQFEKLTLPTTKNPQKFSQRLELQQQVQQFPTQQFPAQQFSSQQFKTQSFPTQQFVTSLPSVQPLQQQVFASPYQLAAVQDGSYYIQLPNGVIEKVNYYTQPSPVDNSVLAKLEFRPVAAVQTTVAEPQLYVNTLVQSQVTTDQ